MTSNDEGEVQYHAILDNGNDIVRKLRQSVGVRVYEANSVIVDTNFVWNGALPYYLEKTSLKDLDVNVIGKANQYLNFVGSLIKRDQVHTTAGVIKELDNLETMVDLGISSLKRQGGRITSDFSSQFELLQEHTNMLTEIKGTLTGKRYTVSNAQLYNSIRALVDHLDDKVEARERADKEIATTALYDAITQGISPKTARPNVTVLSSDKHVKKLIGLAYQALIHYNHEGENKLKDIFKTNGSDKGVVIHINGYRHAERKMVDLWDSTRPLNGSGLGSELVSGADSGVWLTGISKIVGRVYSEFMKIAHPGYGPKVEDDLHYTQAWLRERYHSGRSSLETVGENTILIRGKMDYDAAAREVAAKIGDQDLVDFIDKDITLIEMTLDKIMNGYKDKLDELELNYKLVGEQMTQGVPFDGLRFKPQDLSDQIKRVKEQIAEVNKFEVVKIEDVPAPKEDRLYKPRELAELYDLGKGRAISSHLAALRKYNGVKPTADGRYNSETARMLNIRIHGIGLTKMAYELGIGKPTLNAVIHDPELTDYVYFAGTKGSVLKSAIPIIHRLLANNS